MKIGDKFEDGGITYEVIGQNDSGFISRVYVPTKEVKTEESTPKRRTRTVKEDV